MSSRVAPGGWTAWRAGIAAAMAIVAGAHLAVFVRYLAFPYGDLGWTIEHIVYNAWQMVHGPPMYVDPVAGEPTAFHYPPGLTLLVAPLVALFGPELWTARLVNALATVLSIVLLTRETARRVRDRRLAAFAPGLVFLLASASFSSMLWVHPENWAVAWSLLALVLAGRREASVRGALLAALASFAAVATKQTMLIHVPAVALVLAMRRPRAALVYLASGAALLLAGTALGQALTEGRFLDYVLLSESFPLEWSKLPGILGYLASYLSPCLLLWLASLRYGEPRPGLRALLRDPFAVALALSLPALGYVLIMLPAIPNNLLLPAMLLVPLSLQGLDALLPALARHRALAASGAVACLLWSGVRVGTDVPPLWRNIEQYEPRRAVCARLEQIVRESRDSIWVPQGIAFAYRNGAQVIAPVLVLYDFREVHPEIFDRILARVEAGEFRTILVPAQFADATPAERFRAAFRRHYRVAEVVGENALMGTFTPVMVLRRRD